MSIKKHIALLALPVLLLPTGLTGCSPDSVEPPSPDATRSIVFGAAQVSGGTGAQVESRSTLLNSLDEGTTAVVYGYCVPLSVSLVPDPTSAGLPWTNKANYSVPDIFPGSSTTAVIGDGTDLTVNNGRLTYAGALKPWFDDDDATYSFISYYPKGYFTYTRNYSGNSTTGSPKFTFTMPGDAANDHTAIPDAMVAARFDHRKADGQVHLTYRHILTALRFQINNYSEEELTLHSLSFSGEFYSKAEFTFETGAIVQNTPADKFNGNWTLVSSDMKVSSNSGRPLGDGTEGTSVMLLSDQSVTPSAGNPADCLGTNKKIRVEYSIGTQRYVQELDIKLMFKPAGGTSYALNLNFVGNEFVVFFIPEDLWENGSDNNIEIN